MTIEAVVFDIGGVLVTEVARAEPVWERRLGLAEGALWSALLPIWTEGSVGAIDLPEVHRRVADIVGEAQVDAFLHDVWAAYLGEPNEALIAYFDGLSGRVRTAMLSNSFVGAREKEAERYGFDAMCEFIIYSHEVGLQKPDARIYALTCERLGLRPERVVFVDDRVENIEAANEFGLSAVLCVDPAQTIAEVESRLRG